MTSIYILSGNQWHPSRLQSDIVLLPHGDLLPFYLLIFNFVSTKYIGYKAKLTVVG